MTIKQLESEKTRLAAALEESSRQLTAANESKTQAEETVDRVRLTLEQAQRDKETLQRDVKNLTHAIETFRRTTSVSVGEFVKRLRLDLSLCDRYGETFIEPAEDARRLR